MTTTTKTHQSSEYQVLGILADAELFARFTSEAYPELWFRSRRSGPEETIDSKEFSDRIKTIYRKKLGSSPQKNAVDEAIRRLQSAFSELWSRLRDTCRVAPRRRKLRLTHRLRKDHVAEATLSREERDSLATNFVSRACRSTLREARAGLSAEELEAIGRFDMIQIIRRYRSYRDIKQAEYRDDEEFAFVHSLHRQFRESHWKRHGARCPKSRIMSQMIDLGYSEGAVEKILADLIADDEVRDYGETYDVMTKRQDTTPVAPTTSEKIPRSELKRAGWNFLPRGERKAYCRKHYPHLFERGDPHPNTLSNYSKHLGWIWDEQRSGWWIAPDLPR